MTDERIAQLLKIYTCSGFADAVNVYIIGKGLENTEENRVIVGKYLRHVLDIGWRVQTSSFPPVIWFYFPSEAEALGFIGRHKPRHYVVEKRN